MGSIVGDLGQGIGDILGGNQASSASSDASSAITASIPQALGYETAGLNTATGVETPYINAGNALLPSAASTGASTYGNIASLMNSAMGAYNGGDVALSPTTQYEVAQATPLLNQQLASRGLYNSGAAVAGLSNLDANLVSQNYQQAFTNANTANQAGLSATNPLLSAGSSNAQSLGGQAVSTGANQATTALGGTEAAAGYTAQAGAQQGLATQEAGNAFGNMESGIGNAFGSMTSGIGSLLAFFAEGGRPSPGQPAIVGEKGPEVFVPDRPGTIVPNQAGLSSMPSISKAEYDSVREQETKRWMLKQYGEKVKQSLDQKSRMSIPGAGLSMGGR